MSAAVSSSKIPVAAHRRQSTSSSRGSPERSTPPPSQTKRKNSSPSKLPTPAAAASSSAKERPQSIDIEDEFKNTLQYARLVATLQQHQETASPKLSPLQGGDVTSPSRIPVALRKLSAESPERSSGESSPAKSRRNGNDSSSQAEVSGPVSSSCEDSLSPQRSKIPTLRGPRSTSPPKKQPVFGWSLPTEKQTSPSSKSNTTSPEKINSLNRQLSSSTSSVSSSTTNSRTPKSGSDSATEQLIAGAEESSEVQPQRSKKRQYEAFVMTGDRMICMAKTPANAHFAKTNHRQAGDLELVPYSDELCSSVPSSPAKHDAASSMLMRDPPVARRDNLRSSTSEDQLLSTSDVISPTTSELLEDASGSVDTLLATHDTLPMSKEPPNKESIIAKNARKASLRLNPQQPEQESKHAHSPDFSTSSLISSEHYNGESLLDHDNLSPQTSSSPETPEWSLMDSFHKQQRNTEAKSVLQPIASVDEQGQDESLEDPIEIGGEAIKSEGNRVIITIGSTGAPTALDDHSLSDDAKVMQQQQSYPSINSAGTADSSEESDLESLRSYHPPARPIDVPSAERLAKRLFYLDGFKRTDVSRHLGKNNEFSQVVAEEYLRFFDFGGGITLDAALRRFLQHFCLTGETQERERVLLHFSRRYLECNPDFVENPAKQLYRSLDAVHTLTCAIMLLNTDLHGESVGLQRKMTCNEFIENLRELNDGENFPRDLLRSLYYSIKELPVPWAAALEETMAATSDEQVDPVKQVMATFSDAGSVLRTNESNEPSGPGAEGSGGGANVAIGKTGGGINPFINLPDPSTAVDFKKGYVMRKCCVDSNGKKTKLGKRSWRMYFVSLRDMVLYCFKDEKSVRQPGAFEDFSAAIRIHHGLAVRASDYTKKQFVFRLHTADRAEYLFQTSDEKELLTWIDAINYVVASFSAPPLPAPCSSAGRFQRPLMPSSKSSLGLNDQLSSHESQLGQLRSDFEELLRSAPPKHAKSTVWQNYREKEDFLQFEIMRYETYILTLRTKNAHDHGCM